MRLMRAWKVMQLPWGHTASRCQSWCLNKAPSIHCKGHMIWDSGARGFDLSAGLLQQQLFNLAGHQKHFRGHTHTHTQLYAEHYPHESDSMDLRQSLRWCIFKKLLQVILMFWKAQQWSTWLLLEPKSPRISSLLRSTDPAQPCIYLK